MGIWNLIRSWINHTDIALEKIGTWSQNKAYGIQIIYRLTDVLIPRMVLVACMVFGYYVRLKGHRLFKRKECVGFVRLIVLSMIILFTVLHPFLHLSRLMSKPTKWHVRPAKTQISLGIRSVWSESSLSAWRKLGSLATYWAYSEDWSEWAEAQADLSLRWAHMSFCWFCHEAAHFIN